GAQGMDSIRKQATIRFSDQRATPSRRGIRSRHDPEEREAELHADFVCRPDPAVQVLHAKRRTDSERDGSEKRHTEDQRLVWPNRSRRRFSTIDDSDVVGGKLA